MIERGQRMPHLETLVRIAAALGVSLSQLFIEDYEPAANDLPLLSYLGTQRLSPDDVKALLLVARAMFKGGPPWPGSPAGELLDLSRNDFPDQPLSWRAVHLGQKALRTADTSIVWAVTRRKALALDATSFSSAGWTEDRSTRTDLPIRTSRKSPSFNLRRTVDG